MDNFKVSEAGIKRIAEVVGMGMDAEVKKGTRREGLYKDNGEYYLGSVLSDSARFSWCWYTDNTEYEYRGNLLDRLEGTISYCHSYRLSQNERDLIRTIALMHQEAITYPEDTAKLREGTEHKQRELFKISIASGEVSKSGVNRIIQLLTNAISKENDARSNAWDKEHPTNYYPEDKRHLYLSVGTYTLTNRFARENWSWLWTVGGKGKYVGTLPKRLSKWVKLNYKFNLPKDVLTEIGNIGQSNVEEPAEYLVDFTNIIDWGKNDFGQRHSCWWGSEAIELLQNNGYALRFFREQDAGLDEPVLYGFGRIWVVPCKPKADTFIVFNGYGMADGYNSSLIMARILASYYGLSYKYIALSNEDGDDDVYINAGGYVIGLPEAIEGISHHDLEWGESQYVPCAHCGSRVHLDSEYTYHYEETDSYYCDNCWSHLFAACHNCNEFHEREGMQTVYRTHPFASERSQSALVCQECYAEEYSRCVHCNASWHTNDMYATPDAANNDDEHYVCPRCYRRHYARCETCHDMHLRDDMVSMLVGVRAVYYCKPCFERDFVQCYVCQKSVVSIKAIPEAQGHICTDCLTRRDNLQALNEQERMTDEGAPAPAEPEMTRRRYFDTKMSLSSLADQMSAQILQTFRIPPQYLTPNTIASPAQTITWQFGSGRELSTRDALLDDSRVARCNSCGRHWGGPGAWYNFIINEHDHMCPECWNIAHPDERIDLNTL